MKQKRLWLIAATFCLLALGVFYWWAKSEHQSREAMQVASTFLKLLEAKQFSQAFELTVKRGFVGKSPEELQRAAAREHCKVDRLAYTFPFQSNGNRLRRLVTGNEVDMPEIHVEFTGACLLRVTLRRTSQNEWRVVGLYRHAG
jgi:hypothetical protein